MFAALLGAAVLNFWLNSRFNDERPWTFAANNRAFLLASGVGVLLGIVVILIAALE